MKNKIALVAGATSGIGKAAAYELAARSAVVYVGGQCEEAGQMVVKDIKDSGGGAIVNVSSTTGVKAYASSEAYVASKHAVEGLSKSAALDYANQGIRINTVAPGPTRTSEIAKGIAWLLSDEASYAVGTTLVIDGGAVMARGGAGL